MTKTTTTTTTTDQTNEEKVAAMCARYASPAARRERARLERAAARLWAVAVVRDHTTRTGS